MGGIAFIGGGNMATAIVGGLIANGMKPAEVTVVDPNADRRHAVRESYGVQVTDDVAGSCERAQTIILAVKPQAIRQVAEVIASPLKGKLVMSMAAGVPIASLEGLFGHVAIARLMPNTPARLRLGATGLFVNDRTSAAQRATARAIIEAFGICVEVEREELLDAVTAVSGSGPAYYFLMIEEMIHAGTELGLSREDAKALTLQTALGAATMAARGDRSPEELRAEVTSPNGTTHAAIAAMQDGGFGQVIRKAIHACRDRAIELGTG